MNVLVVIGTGSLARSTCLALASLTDRPLRVVVVGRTRAAVHDVVHVCAVRSSLTGGPVRFEGEVAADHRAWPSVMASARPRGVLLAASTQSPWEGTDTPSAWTEVVSRAGFGLTLPFHCELAVPAAQAAESAGAWFVNACFPDAVNAVVTRLGLPVLCGVGNVATLAAHLRLALGVDVPDRLHVVAHHRHLHPDDDEARAWLDGEPVPRVGDLLAPGRSTDRRRLNDVTGATAAQLLAALLGDEMRADHCPGPHGLAGGYPVHAGQGTVALRLPPGTSADEAITVNERAAVRDGVAVLDGQVHLTRLDGADEVAADLRVPLDLPARIAVGDLVALREHLSSLRDHLRGVPAGAAAPVLVEEIR